MAKNPSKSLSQDLLDEGFPVQTLLHSLLLSHSDLGSSLGS